MARTDYSGTPPRRTPLGPTKPPITERVPRPGAYYTQQLSQPFNGNDKQNYGLIKGVYL